MNIKKALGNIDVDIQSIQDEKLRSLVALLLNVVEHISKENDELKKKVQSQADEINRLKGEKGKPTIRPQKNGNSSNHSSESERKNSEEKPDLKKKAKNGSIKIDRSERCGLDAELLPDDVIFKGYRSVIVQDIKITTDNVRLERACYYSPSLKKWYLAPLPAGYEGQFGPTIKALILDLYQDGGMTEPALKRFFQTHNVSISSGKISSIITDTISPFHDEKTAIVDAGLSATDYHHLDDTASRVNGKNHHAHILCNPFFTAYFTLPNRDRLSALQALSNGKQVFCLNKEAYVLMTELGLSEKRLSALKALNLSEGLMEAVTLEKAIKTLFPDEHHHTTSQRIIREAAAIVAYQQHYNKTKILLTDGARQFQRLTQHHGLCWVHEGRHYKKLMPVLMIHRELLDAYRAEFWQYYRRLLDFKKAPKHAAAKKLSKDFDLLFSRKTGYLDLDERIASTLAEKERLLLALKFPHIPLHNNAAEGGARIQARKRDISFQTKNAKGTQAKDTLMTIIETAKKLRVNTFNYIYDRLSKKFAMTSLADLILQQANIAPIAA